MKLRFYPSDQTGHHQKICVFRKVVLLCFSHFLFWITFLLAADFLPCCCRLALGTAPCLPSKDTFPSVRTPNHVGVMGKMSITALIIQFVCLDV